MPLAVSILTFAEASSSRSAALEQAMASLNRPDSASVSHSSTRAEPSLADIGTSERPDSRLLGFAHRHPPVCLWRRTIPKTEAIVSPKRWLTIVSVDGGRLVDYGAYGLSQAQTRPAEGEKKQESSPHSLAGRRWSLSKGSAAVSHHYADYAAVDDRYGRRVPQRHRKCPSHGPNSNAASEFITAGRRA